MTAEMRVRSDRELVSLAREGCHDAFGELMGRHYQSYVRVASVILCNRAEAMDEVQNACCKAFTNLHQYQGEAEFSTWMQRIVVNQCLMLLRVRKHWQLLHIDADRDFQKSCLRELPALAADPENELIEGELRGLLHRELRRLPQLLRKPLILRDMQQLPMRNVAELLNISLAAAKARLFRARRELKARVIRRLGSEWHNVCPAAGRLRWR